MANAVTTLQDAIVDRLKDDATLSAVRILAENRQDLAAELDIALAQLGLCIVVGTSKLRVSNVNVPGPVFDSVQFTVSVTEDVLINRAPGGLQMDSLSTAMAVAECLHHWRPVDVAPFSGRTCMVDTDAVQYQQQDDLLAYDVNFNLGK